MNTLYLIFFFLESIIRRVAMLQKREINFSGSPPRRPFGAAGSPREDKFREEEDDDLLAL